MTATQSTAIQSLSVFENRPVDTSVAYVLLWLAINSDSPQRLNESNELKKSLSTLTLPNTVVRTLISLARAQDDDDLAAVFDVLSEQLGADEKAFLLQMAVGIAAESEILSPSVNHILRFIADVLSLGQDYLSDLYRAQTNNQLHDPEDLGSPAWWREKESEDRRDDGPNTSLNRIAALKILGLEHSASLTEIKQAYRRLVQVYHPDRYERHGIASSEVAEEKFLQIQKAYEVLKQ